MAQAIRPGGVYQVGEGRFVNASGEPVEAPTRKERGEQREADQQAEREAQAVAEQQRLAEAREPRAARGRA